MVRYFANLKQNNKMTMSHHLLSFKKLKGIITFSYSKGILGYW